MIKHKQIQTVLTEASLPAIVSLINSGYDLANLNLAEEDKPLYPKAVRTTLTNVIYNYAELVGIMNHLHHILGKIKLRDLKGNKEAWELVKIMRSYLV